MNNEDYRARLLKIERELTARTARLAEMGREQFVGDVVDAGDESVIDESASEDFRQADRYSFVLGEVEAALRRIDDGTFGRCIVDGGPIEPQRLDVIPWTPYCLRHQKRLETAAGLKIPTI